VAMDNFKTVFPPSAQLSYFDNLYDTVTGADAACLVTEWHEFQVDSGGAGKFRGGLGVRYSIRFYDEAPFLAVFGDGVENPPFGLYGGHPGTCNRLLVNEGTPTEEVLPAKGMRQLKKGDTYTVYSSGGGGWGDPRERDRAAVLDDVRNGYVSREAAEKVYGVVIRDT